MELFLTVTEEPTGRVRSARVAGVCAGMFGASLGTDEASPVMVAVEGDHVGRADLERIFSGSARGQEIFLGSEEGCGGRAAQR